MTRNSEVAERVRRFENASKTLTVSTTWDQNCARSYRLVEVLVMQGLQSRDNFRVASGNVLLFRGIGS
jgi:hypothetical protein